MACLRLLGELQFARFEKQLCRLQVVHDLLESADRQVVHILQRVARRHIDSFECLQVAQHAVKNHVVAAADVTWLSRLGICSEVIFLAGNTAHSAQLKLSGALNYCYEDKEEVVTGAHWMAEADRSSAASHCQSCQVALWTPWVYLGDLVSSEVSRVAALDVQGFHDALSSSWQTQRAASHYASGFLAAMGSDSANWTDGFVMQGKVGAKESATVHNETLQTRSFCHLPASRLMARPGPCFNRPRVQDFQPVGPRRGEASRSQRIPSLARAVAAKGGSEVSGGDQGSHELPCSSGRRLTCTPCQDPNLGPPSAMAQADSVFTRA